MAVDLDVLRKAEKQRYIAEHAPYILCALIGRRAATDPHVLVDAAVETASIMYDAVMPKPPKV